MSYARLSQVYDALMQDVPYTVWTNFFEQMVELYGCNVNMKLDVLDLGCGTGRFLLYLAKNGHHSIGIDLSEEMLAVADENLQNAQVYVPLMVQSMDDFMVNQSFDVVTIFCDGFNYLPNLEAVYATFRQVYKHLRSGGILLFDVHTPYKMYSEFYDETYSILADDYAVIWNTFLEKETLTVRHEFTYFMDFQGTGQYERFEESQVQKTFELEVYQQALKETGFECKFLGDEQMQPVQPDCTRWFICAKKI